MNRANFRWLTLFFGLALCGSFVATNAASLSVGDPAPKLQVSKWVQGEPVKEFDREHAYLLEFWATWCGPCREAIPHVNELQTKFKSKGLIVIGQDVWENDPDNVAPFVKKMGGKMTYRVALDTEEGGMAKTWMEAADQHGIPATFIVDKKGRIAWIGHPMTLKESLIEQILGGTFDLEKAIADYEREQKIEQQTGALWKQLNQYRRNKEWERAASTLDEIEKLVPEDRRDDLAIWRFNLLLDQKNYTAAYKLAAAMSDSHLEEPMMQNQLAWVIATRDDIADRDLNLAAKIARQANETTKGQNAEILDTLARVLYLQGQKESAIEFQEKAVQFAEGERRRQFQRNLDNYRAGKLPNEAAIGRLQEEIEAQIQKKEWDKAEGTLRELEALLSPEEKEQLATERFRVLVGRKSYGAAEELIRQWIAKNPDEAMALNDLAWSIAISDDVQSQELDVAEKVARLASDATQGNNAEILDTLARILFRKDQKQSAIELQEKAVALLKGNRKTQFQETLDSYKRGELPKAY